MKSWYICLFVFAFLFSCKREQLPICSRCSCVSEVNNVIPADAVFTDSATFFQSILGVWYIREKDTSIQNKGCVQQCYCDTLYPVTFLANGLIILSFPGYGIDTLNYSYGEINDSIEWQSLTLIIPGKNPMEGEILYTSNYLGICMPEGVGLSSPPTYYLTRH